jgi:hypothetical protein
MEPFQKRFVVGLDVGIANGGAFETVPDGKRAVIEHVSVYDTGLGAKTADYFIIQRLKTVRLLQKFQLLQKLELLAFWEVTRFVRSPRRELSSVE